MNRADYASVLDGMRLADGTLYPIPVTLPVPKEADVRLDGEVALSDQ
jgi:sulfate adenylyltransferase